MKQVPISAVYDYGTGLFGVVHGDDGRLWMRDHLAQRVLARQMTGGDQVIVFTVFNLLLTIYRFVVRGIRYTINIVQAVCIRSVLNKQMCSVVIQRRLKRHSNVFLNLLYHRILVVKSYYTNGFNARLMLPLFEVARPYSMGTGIFDKSCL